ncbi:MAG: HDOD domain-containing protein [Desulfobacteraceae bacterium]|nr:HDOD domain-containing protein [Desulfobacteraceae bacterium]
MIKGYSIEEIGNKIKSLPLIDKAVYDIIPLLNNPDTNYEKISEKLSPDLSARFLRMANMARTGREVRAIKHAVRLLGFKEMKNILISSILIDHLTRRIDMRQFSFEKFQIQANFCAAISRILGEMINYSELDDLFTVSVLHNIGKLIIVVYFNEEHAKINIIKQEKNIPTREAELEVLGATHSEIGAMVLERFNIPKDICDAVRFHDVQGRDISESSNFELEFIFRQAASIVWKFSLPVDMEITELIKKMEKTITIGKAACMAETRSKIRSRGYEKVFFHLLNEASDITEEGLKKILSVR